MKWLFINTVPGQCSIHEKGLEIYSVLRKFGEPTYRATEAELKFDEGRVKFIPRDGLNDPGKARDLVARGGYEFVVVNYHHTVNHFGRSFEDLPAAFGVPVYAMVTEVMMVAPYACKLHGEWTKVFLLDPTLDGSHAMEQRNVMLRHSASRTSSSSRHTPGHFQWPGPLQHRELVAMPRPIVDWPKRRMELNFSVPHKPNIGFHGFATMGKSLLPMFEQAIFEFKSFNLNIRLPSFSFGSGTEGDKKAVLLREVGEIRCKAQMIGGIDINVEESYVYRERLLEWCADQDLLCYHHEREMPGLASTIDDAVTVGTPVSVSNSSTFRHVHQYQDPYPKLKLRDAMVSDAVYRMWDDWQEEKFRERFASHVLADG